MGQMLRSELFESVALPLVDTVEEIIVGGPDKFHLLKAGFHDIKQIAFIGWGSQAPAQAQNLRDSLKGTDIKVVIGLAEGSKSFAKAAEAGFRVEDGTAGEMFAVVRKSNAVFLLISDAAQTEHIDAIQAAMMPGSTLGFSHGFLLGYLQSRGLKLRDDIDVIGMCPKGMGASVRKLYLQGEGGAGINASYAVEQDVTGHARDVALAWSIGVGSPYTFPTTLTKEYCSDIFGERGILLGAPWGIVEALYLTRVASGVLPIEAFAQSAMCITGPISQAISDGGLLEVAARIARQSGDIDGFYRALRRTYRAARPILEQIYREVSSGREIAAVVDDTARLKTYPWTKVAGSKMWETGVQARQGNVIVPLDATTSGVYLGVMLAQVDILHERGHGWSEICNESIIECVDSLNPYMDKHGVDAMIDGCSTTARLGARKWGPLFRQMVESDVLPQLEDQATGDAKQWFEGHPVHIALAECMKLRPKVRIAVD